MRVISKAPVREFSKKHEDALAPLMHWYGVTKRARWQHLSDLREDFNHADIVDDRVVFNIGANKYRLISSITYRWQIVYVRAILTHKEYDQGKWKE